MSKSIVRSAVEFSVKYKSIIILVVTFMALFGVYALTKMPKQEFPQFSIRQGLVVAVYPGASSDQVEEQVTQPLEEFLFSYKEINKAMTYSVTSDGMVVMYVQLSEHVKSDDEFWSKFRLDAATFKNSLPSGVAGIFTSNDFGSTSALLIPSNQKKRLIVSWKAILLNWNLVSVPFLPSPIFVDTDFKMSRLRFILIKINW